MSEVVRADSFVGARRRSPSYPAVSIERAIERTRELYAKEKLHAAPIEQALTAWGYRGRSGAANVTLASVKKFGLIEEDGSGITRVVRVSALGNQVLNHPQQEMRREGIRRAALRPEIHRELWEEFGNDLPSDDTLAWDLTQDRGFTEAGARDFVKQYRQTLAYARIDGPSHPGKEQSEPSKELVPTVPEPPQEAERPQSLNSWQASGISVSTGPSRSIVVPLPGGKSVVVTGSFPIAEGDWDLMLAILTAMRPGLVEAADASTSSTESGRS